MKTSKTFKDLVVWRKADELFHLVCEDVKRWQNGRMHHAIDLQLLDAVGSISANIAEGYGRGSPREFEQFLRYSRGSAAESDNWLWKAQQQGFITHERYAEYAQRLEELCRMLGSFIYELRKQPSRRPQLDSPIARQPDSSIAR
ncbi:MAG: four helix bundle protein [Candidatus Omnitrophica bacterium]|nr:four helix bundle protein [Candidatus Omnitrophota bacterium]